MRSEALQLSSFIQKKEDDPFTRGGRAGLHCKIVVMNGSQRCEMHNLALFRWVGWAWSVCRVAVAILVKSDSARTFEDLPPTQRCVDSVYSYVGCDRKRFSSAALFKKRRMILSPGAGGRGFTARL